jgi:hypothetical protein
MPVKVQGSHLEFDTIVDNLSAGGICSRSLRKISKGEKLRFLVEFSIVGSFPKTAPKISARGVVTRVRDLHDGSVNSPRNSPNSIS